MTRRISGTTGGPEGLPLTAARRAPQEDGRAERGEATRQRILDAAEALFADFGYHAVSLRDIASRAKTETALASYHFGSKDGLFTAVISRRSDEHRLDMIDRLEAAQAEASPSTPGNAVLVRAYVLPAVEKIARDQGWAAYIKLVVALQNLPASDTSSRLGKAIFDGTIRLFVEAFVKANPTIARDRVVNAVYFLHGTLIHLLSQGQGLEWVERDAAPRAREDLVEDLAQFFSAALSGLANPRA
jgi:AcrR family transcriptional regulator